ncbi:MAG: hypothetical protein K9K64_08885 [Desulfohalobiaceae bacterium]|nr:hypothetical protein [Desulfohalobiaceae bacterium]
MSKHSCLITLSITLILYLAGCAHIPVPTRSVHSGESGPPGRCADFFASLDARIRESGALDPGVFRVKGYPYLRLNRFLASFGAEAADSEAAFTAWVDRMQDLDQKARTYETANLSGSDRAASESAKGGTGLKSRIAACGDLLKAIDFEGKNRRKDLAGNISAPDDYIRLRRILGVSPITGWFVLRGVLNWQEKVRERFSLKPPADWKTIRYLPDLTIDPSTFQQRPIRADPDALGIPSYSPADLKVLFRMHAPVWEIQAQGDHDRIGRPVWTKQETLGVDTGAPTTYTRLSFTRFGKDILTQLNYIIWFPARPRTGPLDLYGGLLDGVNLRVTLDKDGQPLLYESMHNCGCYYKAYPTPGLQVRREIDYEEPPLILKAPDLDPARQRLVLAMESGTHFVQHIYPVSRIAKPPATGYSLADYSRLRSLPASTGERRSMFAQNSIAPGSERLERFLLWPTGVLSPGAMRQWGRHAVAFKGRRHFDDPFYMDRMFTRK